MRFTRVFFCVATVLGMSAPALAAPAPRAASATHAKDVKKDTKSAKRGAKEHAKGSKKKSAKSERTLMRASATRTQDSRATSKKTSKSADKRKDGAKGRGGLERASVVRTEQRVRDELSHRTGHEEPSDAELMEWLSHGATRATRPESMRHASANDRGGLTAASAKKIEKKSEKPTREVEKSKDEKPAREVEKKVEPTKGEKPARDAEPTKGDKPAREADKGSKKLSKNDKSDRAKTAPICLGPSIEILRGKEHEQIPLTRCDGKADEQGVLRLSILARPGSVERPALVRREEDLGAGIKKVDSGLAERLTLLATRFGTKAAPASIEIISGFRPNSKGSYHSHAQAMDIRVQGARNEDVVAYCKTLQDTGCGYYPNSAFVHVDVRAPGTGHISWIDASGPGESPRYVASWPPPKGDDSKTEESKAKTDESARKGAEEPAKSELAKAEPSDPAKSESAKSSEPAQIEPADTAKSEPAKNDADIAKNKPAKSEGELPALPAPN